MARKSKTAVLKRQRELKKAEKAAAKREKRAAREGLEPERTVATAEDLAGYGFSIDDESDADPEQ